MKNSLMLIGVLFALLVSISIVGSYQTMNTPDDGTVTPSPQPILTEIQARMIAASTCVKGGETLGVGIYNENSKTWWFDANLNATRSGCNPACVVNEETKSAEINWRCTGAILPPSSSSEIIRCSAESRKGDMCPAIYGPVCATVNVQCIKAPCPPIQQTFPAPCEACHNPLVSEYVPGECPVATGTLVK